MSLIPEPTTDKAMELLALLSTVPAPVRLLCADLNIDGTRQLTELVNVLCAKGYAVIIQRNPPSLVLAPRGFAVAYRDALKYADAVDRSTVEA